MQLMSGWRQRPLAAARSGPTQSRPRRARGILLTAVGPVRLSVAITLALAYSGYALAQQVQELPTQNLPANMFAVPGLGRGFVGQWAGWIRPDPAGFHGSKLPAPWADGIFFGESKGVVYMRGYFSHRRSGHWARKRSWLWLPTGRSSRRIGLALRAHRFLSIRSS